MFVDPEELPTDPQEREDVLDRLAPLVRLSADDLSELQLSIGSSGVPETFVVDGQGVIRYQHIGEIEPNDVPVILAQLEQAK